MSKKIGLTADGEREWEGPVLVEVMLYKRYTQTARYSGSLDKGTPFELYVPLFMLGVTKAEALPKVLGVAIDRSGRSRRTIGLLGEWRPLAAEPGVSEFAFVAKKARWKVYQLKRDKYLFSVYVPNAVFGDRPHPPRIFVRLFER